MTIPTWEEAIPLILKNIKEKEDFTRREIYEELKNKFSQEEQEEQLKSGYRKLENRFNWAFSHLFKAEYIELSLNGKFQYKVTEAGKEACEPLSKLNRKEIKAYLKENSNFEINWETGKKLKNIKTEEIEEDEDFEQSEDNFETELQSKNQDTGSKLLEYLKSKHWIYFEEFCADLITKIEGKEFTVINRKEYKGGGDGGQDGVLEDELGMERIVIQCKRFADASITPDDIRSFKSVVADYKAAVGIFFTTTKFSEKAIEEAKFSNIKLIDGAKLIALCQKYQHGLKVRILEIYDADF